MHTLIVRQATLSDVDEIVPLFDLYRQFYGRASDTSAVKEFLLARFNHGESVLFIALDKSMPVGFAQLYPSFSSASLARTFILNDLFVLECARRRGVASRLMSVAVEFATTLGAVRLTLSTEIKNVTAQALYRSAGWKQDEQFRVFHHVL